MSSDPARRERPLGGARHVPIETPVREVVYRAAGRAHQEDAKREDDERMFVRMAARGEPQRPQRRPQQQQRADRTVEPYEARVLAERRHRPRELGLRAARGYRARRHLLQQGTSSGRNTSCISSRRPRKLAQRRRAHSMAGASANPASARAASGWTAGSGANSNAP